MNTVFFSLKTAPSTSSTENIEGYSSAAQTSCKPERESLVHPKLPRHEREPFPPNVKIAPADPP